MSIRVQFKRMAMLCPLNRGVCLELLSGKDMRFLMCMRIHGKCVGICACMPAMILTFYVGSAYIAVCLAKVAYVKSVSQSIPCICVHLGGYAYGFTITCFEGGSENLQESPRLYRRQKTSNAIYVVCMAFALLTKN